MNAGLNIRRHIAPRCRGGGGGDCPSAGWRGGWSRSRGWSSPPGCGNAGRFLAPAGFGQGQYDYGEGNCHQYRLGEQGDAQAENAGEKAAQQRAEYLPARMLNSCRLSRRPSGFRRGFIAQVDGGDGNKYAAAESRHKAPSGQPDVAERQGHHRRAKHVDGGAQGQDGTATVPLGQVSGGQAGDESADAEQTQGNADFGSGYAVFLFEKQRQHRGDDAHAETVQRHDDAEVGNAPIATPAAPPRCRPSSAASWRRGIAGRQRAMVG